MSSETGAGWAVEWGVEAPGKWVVENMDERIANTRARVAAVDRFFGISRRYKGALCVLTANGKAYTFVGPVDDIQFYSCIAHNAYNKFGHGSGMALVE